MKEFVSVEPDSGGNESTAIVPQVINRDFSCLAFVIGPLKIPAMLADVD